VKTLLEKLLKFLGLLVLICTDSTTWGKSGYLIALLVNVLQSTVPRSLRTRTGAGGGFRGWKFFAPKFIGRFILSEKGYDLDYSYIDKQDKFTTKNP
jgi:hypothetical protein